ncbi:hypothetical protein [Planctomyces sp. SH-PL62]|uniref:hypothetical protein n=1 Tax=Planctomyces sp. SH-PL62 TaxID=1636152 RepID=UPI00078E5FC0|nr:hypothetical protein [Planctomyces sp. SH-PL62]AMV37741.1 hypothetical protein VT85_09915 [Planctomyces sp. SH-PL62]
MSNEPDDVRREMIALLGRIVGSGPLPADLQRTALEMYASLAGPPPEPTADLSTDEIPTADTAALFPEVLDGGAAAAASVAAPAAVGSRRLVYVHGICRHDRGYSDPWWAALQPFVPTAFGPGTRGETRLEVLWSDIVNQASGSLRGAVFGAASADALPDPVARRERARAAAAEEIKETLRDRADQQTMAAAAAQADGLAGAAGAGLLGAGAAAAAPAGAGLAGAEMAGLISIPGASCIDDFSIYLVDDAVRKAIVDRFLAVVRPELAAGRGLDVIAHSWGTVVAYEGLRQLEDDGLRTPLVRNFFTVGAALSIGAVKLRLRPANKDGRKPANVRNWVNLDARGDVVGGPLKGRPYAVDADFVNLAPSGCGSFLGLVNPQCSHSSYFRPANATVNRDVFARFIN